MSWFGIEKTWVCSFGEGVTEHPSLPRAKGRGKEYRVWGQKTGTQILAFAPRIYYFVTQVVISPQVSSSPRKAFP